jgi:pimeloyl-ACP methyl ester carboxylesterase
MATPTAVQWDTTTIQVAGGPVSIKRAGSGPAVLVLPRDNGHAPNSDFVDALAAEFTVHHPWLPGFHNGHPEAWEWLSNVRDLAVVMRQALDALDLGQAALIGFGFGGWLAAEMAAMGERRFSRLALVNPMGIQPRSDYILDQFLISTEAYARAGFSNDEAFDAVYGAEPEFEQLESWETDREMTSRLAWKPYMYNPNLAKLLGSVSIPALVVRGGNDRVVPAECASLYSSALPNARLEVLSNAGHAIDAEQPGALSDLIIPFLRQ